MTTTKQPFGMQPVRVRGGQPANGALNTYNVGVSAGPDDIGTNDPLMMRNGVVTRLSGTDYRPFGVAKGFVWVDPVQKRPQWASYLPAGTSSFTGQIQALVVDDPDATFIVQADATVSAAMVGLNFTLSAVGSINSLGQSQAVLKVGTLSSTAGTVRIMGVYDIPGNVIDDAFTIVEVQWVGAQAYAASVG